MHDLNTLKNFAKDVIQKRYGHLTTIQGVKDAAAKKDYLLCTALDTFGSTKLPEENRGQAKAYLSTINSGISNTLNDRDWQQIVDWINSYLLNQF